MSPDSDLAVRALRLAVSLFDEGSTEALSEDHAETVRSLTGVLVSTAQDNADSESNLRESLTLYRRSGDSAAEADTLVNLGALAYRRQQFDEADRRHLIETEHRYRLSLELERRHGDEDRQATILHVLGTIVEKRGNLREALQLVEQAAAIFGRLNRPGGQRYAEQSIARIRAKLKDGE